MTNCGFTTKNTCGERLFATCVYYEGVLPGFSSLAVADCYTLEEIVADTYLLFENINDQIEVNTVLGNKCLTYTLEAGIITVRQALVTLESEVCDLKDKLDNIAKYQLCDLPIAGCDLTLQDLVNECDTTITNFGELFQALIDRTASAIPAANLVAIDVTNTAGSSKDIVVYQSAETTQTITIPALSTTAVTIDNSKPVTIVADGGISPTGAFSKLAGGSTVEGLDRTLILATGLLASFVLGPNNNPQLEIFDVS